MGCDAGPFGADGRFGYLHQHFLTVGYKVNDIDLGFLYAGAPGGDAGLNSVVFTFFLTVGLKCRFDIFKIICNNIIYI